MAPRKPVRTMGLGNMGHVSDPGQEDARLEEVRTTHLPLRMTENSSGQLLLPGARMLRQPSCPTDPHSPLKCPSCGSDQEAIVCWRQALAKKKNKTSNGDQEKVSYFRHTKKQSKHKTSEVNEALLLPR